MAPLDGAGKWESFGTGPDHSCTSGTFCSSNSLLLLHKSDINQERFKPKAGLGTVVSISSIDPPFLRFVHSAELGHWCLTTVTSMGRWQTKALSLSVTELLSSASCYQVCPSASNPTVMSYFWKIIASLYKTFSEGRETISWVRDWHVKYYHLQNTGLKPPWRQRSWAWATAEGKQECHNHVFIFRENEKLNKL